VAVGGVEVGEVAICQVADAGVTLGGETDGEMAVGRCCRGWRSGSRWCRRYVLYPTPTTRITMILRLSTPTTTKARIPGRTRAQINQACPTMTTLIRLRRSTAAVHGVTWAVAQKIGQNRSLDDGSSSTGCRPSWTTTKRRSVGRWAWLALGLALGWAMGMAVTRSGAWLGAWLSHSQILRDESSAYIE
jgi:hypothetical protein